MPGSIDRDEVQRLLRETPAQLLEVLPAEEFEWAHLQGALHFDLKQFSRDAARRMLDPAREVIVYCNDFL
jgi:rhodanese-related sulfurtransferase